MQREISLAAHFLFEFGFKDYLIAYDLCAYMALVPLGDAAGYGKTYSEASARFAARWIGAVKAVK